MTNEKQARTKTNEALAELGRRYHDGLPINEVGEILSANGFSLEFGIYCGRDGRVHEQVGEKTWLSLTWHKMELTGRYEVVAYVS